MSVKRSDGDYGTDGRELSAFVTIRFDDPKEAIAMMSTDLAEVVEKLREFTRAGVTRGAEIVTRASGLDFVTADKLHEDAESDSAKAERLIKEEKKEESNEKKMFDAVCGNCGQNTQVPFEPNPKSKKPILCLSCYKKSQ